MGILRKKLVLSLVLFLLCVTNTKTAHAQSCGINIDPANPGAFPTPESVRGSRYVRIEFKDCTPDIEGEENPGFEASLSSYQAAIQGYNSVGTGVILILDYASYPLASANIPQFAARAGRIARALSGMDVIYEIWNEPDLPGTFYVPPGTYASILNQTVPALKSNGAGIVITGGLGNGQSPYLESVRSQTSVWGQIDGIGIHPYGASPDPSSPSCNLGGSFGSTLPGYLSWASSISGGKPLYITEFGWPTPNQSDQNRYNTCFFQSARSNPNVRTIVLYTWSDAQGANWGIVSGSNQPKQTYGGYFAACGTSTPSTIANQPAISLSGGSCLNSTRPPEVDRLTRPCTNLDQPSDQPLRPYPFNPCDPFIPERNTMSFQCGNGLNVNGAFDFPNVRLRDLVNNPGTYPWLDPEDEIALRSATPYKNSEQLYRCRDNPNQICAIQRVPFNVTIDLTGANLPVIGNTESSIPSDSTKVNTYLSWYLQGADWTSSGQVEEPYPQDPIRPYITYAGPIRKLFSQSSQNNIRAIINSSPSDIHNYLLRPVGSAGRMRSANPLAELFSLVPLSSMEDIVGETVVTAISRQNAQPEGVVTPSDPLSVNAVRLYISRAENPPTWGSDGRLYFPHLRETYGLSYLLQNYALPTGERGTYSGTGPTPTRTPIFADPRIRPIYPDCGITDTNQGNSCSSIGEGDWRRRLIIGTPDKNAHQGETDATIAQFSRDTGAYGETWTRNTEIVDNPINNGSTNEVKRSGSAIDITNSLDTPSLVTGRAPAPRIVEQSGRFVSSPDPAPASFTGVCTISDAITHSGDSLVDRNGWSINARLTYTQVFRYDALPDPCNMPGEDAPTCFLNQGGRCSNGLPCGNGYSCEATESLETCTSNCVTNTGQTRAACEAQCIAAGAGTVGSCQPIDISLPTSARVTVMTKTPLVREIYSSLVSGFQSVLRRFLPQRTPELVNTNSCQAGEYLNGETSRVERDFDQSCIRSVSTSVNYSNSAGSPTANHPSVPDGVSPSTPSTNAQLYFPYLGSLSDYFLGCGSENLNLQRLLRPQGFSSACVSPAINRGLVSACIPGSTTRTPPTNSCGANTGSTPPLGGGIEPGPDSNRPDSARQDTRLFNGRQITIAENQTIGLIDIDGPTDPVAPYFPSMGISESDIASVYMLTGELACLTPVNLIGVRTSPGQTLRLPSSGYNPFGGSNGQAAVVYADCDEITLVYATYDGIQFQNGTSGPYTLHLSGIQVNQNIISAYQSARSSFSSNRALPYLNAGDSLGVGTGQEMILGIRDTGQLMDPRTRKDWWQ